VIMELCNSEAKRQKFQRIRPKSKKKNKVKGYQIRSQVADLCLDTEELSDGGLSNGALSAFRCEASRRSQRFMFTYDIVRV